jgi:hypothetical protein
MLLFGNRRCLTFHNKATRCSITITQQWKKIVADLLKTPGLSQGQTARARVAWSVIPKGGTCTASRQTLPKSRCRMQPLIIGFPIVFNFQRFHVSRLLHRSTIRSDDHQHPILQIHSSIDPYTLRSIPSLPTGCRMVRRVDMGQRPCFTNCCGGGENGSPGTMLPPSIPAIPITMGAVNLLRPHCFTNLTTVCRVLRGSKTVTFRM